MASRWCVSESPQSARARGANGTNRADGADVVDASSAARFGGGRSEIDG